MMAVAAAQVRTSQSVTNDPPSDYRCLNVVVELWLVAIVPGRHRHLLVACLRRDTSAPADVFQETDLTQRNLRHLLP